MQNFIPWHSNCSDCIRCPSTPTETHLRPSPSMIQRFFSGVLEGVTHYHSDTQQWINFGDFFRISGSIATQQTGLIHLCKQFNLSPVPSLLCFWQIDRILTNILTKAFIQCPSSHSNCFLTKNTSSLSPAGDHLQDISTSMPCMQIFLFYCSCKNICHLKYSPLIQAIRQKYKQGYLLSTEIYKNPHYLLGKKG